MGTGRRATTSVLVLALAVLAGCGAPGSSGATDEPPTGVPPASLQPSAPAGPTAPAPTAGATANPVHEVPASGTWARVEIDGAGPAAREDHTWTVSEDGRTAWLFGGRDGGTAFDDVWAFDLATTAWRKVEVVGDAPAARFGHEAAWVPGRGLIVFGGQRGTTFFDDLWLFEPGAGGDSGTWRLLPPGGGPPVARYGSCSGIGPDGRLWISHGFTSDGIRFADTLAYDFAAEAWSDQAPATERPVERCLHTCWWTSDGQLALYGGQTTGVAALGDLWLLTPGDGGANTNEWTEARGQEPAPRHLPAIARHGTATFMFGGRGLDREALGETWVAVDGASGFVPFPTTDREPRARSGAAMVQDPAGNRLVLFGGIGGNALDDVWALTFP